MNSKIDMDGEVYQDEITFWAHEFVEQLDKEEQKHVADRYSAALMFYIHDHLPPNEGKRHDDIKKLDRMFNSFIRVCAMHGIIPSIHLFSLLTGIHQDTFSAWKHGEYRNLTPEYSRHVLKWSEICKAMLVNSLSNSSQTNVNRIFIAKAIYNIRENEPVQPETDRDQIALPASELPKIDVINEGES